MFFWSARLLVRHEFSGDLDATFGMGASWVRLTTGDANLVGQECSCGVRYGVYAMPKTEVPGLTASASVGIPFAHGRSLEINVSYHAYRLTFEDPRIVGSAETRMQHDVITTIGFPLSVRLP